MPSPNSNSPLPRDAEARRSSRIESPLPVIVLGTNRLGESFQERTAALSFNLHGCRFASRFDAPLESWVTLQVTGTDGPLAAPVRARVRSIQSPQAPRELCQVGVELETPANIWGIAAPPEDWGRVLGATNSTSQAAAVAPALIEPSLESTVTEAATQAERRSEVAVFPSPATNPVQAETSPETKEPPEAARETVSFTADQVLQALQGKFQLAAELAVEKALAERLDESVKQAVAKMEEDWKAHARQTEEFSAAGLAEVQSRWERELVVYRSRAEEISKRVEILGTSGRHALTELQKFADRISKEIQPEFDAHVQESFTHASAHLDAKAAELAEQHTGRLIENIQAATLDARAQLDEGIGEARAIISSGRLSAAPGVSEERLDAALKVLREGTLNRTEERLSEVWTQFEQQQDALRGRADEIAQHLELFSTQLNEAQTQHQQSFTEIRTGLANLAATSSLNTEAALQLAKEQIFNHLEWRLGEVSGRTDQQHNGAQQRADELFRRIEDQAANWATARVQLEQSVGELRSLVAANGSVSQPQAEALVNSLREQLLNHVEWRLGEVSSQFERQQDAVRQRSEGLLQRFDAFASEMRNQFEESQSQKEDLLQELRPQDLAALDQSAERAAKEFEVSAARISDRQLVRLLQQKQALSTEASLELEARASETRALLQKAANSTLDDFRGRFEAQIDQVVTEATERAASSMASLDAESRAACESRQREMQLQISRAAEQSTAEFRSGIKAFLYSCLVAAVSGVDEHAQSTLASLGKAPAVLENTAETGSGANSPNGARTPEPRS